MHAQSMCNLQRRQQDSGEEVEVSRWQKATVDDRLKKIKLIMPVDDAVKAILYALPAFLRHVYVKRFKRWHTSKKSKKARRQNV